MQNPALSPTVVLAPIENGYLAYDSASDQVHELNPLGALIAELCDGTRSVERIREEVAPLLPEGKASEVDRWIEEGLKAGLLTSGGDPGASHRDLTAKELFDLAKRLRRGGKTKMAFLCQQTTVKLSGDDPEAWCYLADLAHIIGLRDEARAAYEKYLTLDPDDAEVKHILVALRGEAPPPRAPDECIQQLYGRFASFFDSNLGDLDYQGPERIRDLIQSVMGDRAGLAALELGCGSGLAGVQIKPRASRMVGVDLSPDMIDLARARNIYDQLEVAEITAWLQRSQERFDLIVACDCLIYFGDLRQVALPAAKLLNAGGLFAFTLERGDRHPFHLTDSGRYAHHPDHVREVAAEAGLAVTRLE
jgi:predicted TPR repeat methyltransferase